MLKKPSPRPFALMGYAVIFITFGVLGGWAAVAKLDSAVFAPGQVVLEGNRKVIQHLDGGTVDEILVKEAEQVKKGDVLIRLSDVEAKANLEVINTRLDVARIVEARLMAERLMADDFSVPDDLAIGTASNAVKSAIKDQKGLFKDRHSILVSKSDILKSRIEQTKSQIDGLNLQKDALQRRMDNFKTMMDRMRAGEKKGLIEKNVLSQREDEMIQIEANLGQVISKIAEAKNTISGTKMEILQAEQEYRERANTDMEDIRAKISELEQRKIVAEDALESTTIRAPGTGTIQNLKVHTVGAVVRPGENLMELVPDDEQLIINAHVSPRDIDNVTPGLKAEVRFSAFKTRLTPIILGKVRTVSKDVITPDNPQQAPYYLAQIDVEENDIPENIRTRLTAGMPADLIITTGERTVLNFISSPLVDAVKKSLIEE